MKQRWVWLCVAVWCGAALLLAAYVRLAWIEAPDVAAQCDAGAPGLVCTLRAWAIQAFIHQRLGWTALGLAVLAFGVTSPLAGGIALFLASSGLVLYSTELCAPAALLSALVFANLGHTATPARQHSNAP